MALIKCRECGAAISTEAKACPSCGAKPKKTLTIRTVLGGILGLIILSSIIGNDVNKAKVNKMTPEEKCRGDEYYAGSRAQELVRERLKAPSTAEFSSPSQISSSLDGSGDCIYEVRSNVDAQNSFGAQIRGDYYVKLKWKMGVDEWYLLDIRM